MEIQDGFGSGGAIARVVIGILLVFPMLAGAFQLETVLMPGDLSRAHESIESQCDLCHTRFRKKGRAEKCLDCHDHANVAADIEQGRGFHGRVKNRVGHACESCHTEHKGREADIIGLNQLAFDHAATDFELHGGHRGVQCDACHEGNKKFSEAPGTCFACHEAADVHYGKLGEDCASCHSEKDWRDAGFDHDKTDFVLRGKHRETACLLCHTGNRYKDIPSQCVDCHRLNDVHEGRYRDKCADCHVPDKWSEIDFNHDRETKFALRGKHRDARCSTCHRESLYQEKLQNACVACHRDDDWHKGRNGEKCESCHSEESWRESRFDHDKKTKFPLRGKHARLNCLACHRGSPEKERDKRDCYACHAVSDVHKGGAGKRCADCHDSNDWKKVSFRHAVDARFALDGAHGRLSCNQCHRIAPEEQRLATGCYDCHRANDVHQGQQGTGCRNCHSETSWASQVRFEHDLSNFPLIGQHTLAPCEACHVGSTFKDAPAECVECHADTDEHDGALGRSCGHCHNPNAWTAWLFDHDRQTDFSLQGAHAKLECRQCHSSANERVAQATQCVSCHRSDDVHHGAFGPACDRCHGSASFREINMRR